MVSLIRFRAGRLPCFAAILHLLSAAAAPQTTDSALEYQVKAAFLLNFTKFIDWPPNAFASAESPITVCILGKDPFGRALDDILQGESVNLRRLAVLRINKAPEPRMCQVLFLESGQKDAPEVLSRLGPGVLTVGEGDRFLREGGMIALIVDGHRIRFDVNQAAAANAGLQLSARLLGVARSVEK